VAALVPPPAPGVPAGERLAGVVAMVAAAQRAWREGRDGGRGRLWVLATVVLADLDKAVRIDPATGVALAAGGPHGGGAASPFPVGTPQYTSPEVHHRVRNPWGPFAPWQAQCGPAVDTFALAVCAWAMLRGMLPFNHEQLNVEGGDRDAGQAEVAAQIQGWRILPDAQLPAGTSDGALRMIETAMNHDVAARCAAVPARAPGLAFFTSTLGARALAAEALAALAAAPAVAVPGAAPAPPAGGAASPVAAESAGAVPEDEVMGSLSAAADQ
jgi:hypothetical protein